ncbi:ribonuclease H-like protein [Rhizophagus irregularis]|uniref:Ribonuclease H-like protein n=1 Tax=Rhizophagus irregularis TaxID=588596 RepID=A0A2N1M5V1_9GLOM|nr:ribonuclease H-like protein [Rhizophagus irregularis]
MFLDHIITKDHTFLHDYNTIKKSLQHKGGKIPRWYTFLQDHITINNHRLQKWVMAWIPIKSELAYGKLLTTTHYPNCIPVSYIEHWIYKDLSSVVRNDTPRSLPTTIIQYLLLVETLSKQKKLNLTNINNRNVNTFQLLKYSHPSYRISAYNDYLIQQKKIPPCIDLPITLPIPIRPHNPNDYLISSLITQDSIISDLKNLALMLSDFTELKFYTDGSYQSINIDNESPIGYKWIVANHINDNIFYSGSLKFFPSSTKAETMAILTALIVCPPKCIIEIYTDSQAVIDGFHKSKNLHSISLRRFNKINNNILWSTIHHIINKFSLKVTLFKVKAHSGDYYNDSADALAKAGRLILTPTTINHDHLPSQTITLEWNEEIPLDKGPATRDNLIDWSLSLKWFNFNGLSKKSFKEYHQTFRNNPLSQSSSRNRQRIIRDFNYINPFNYFRNFKLSKDFLYILFTSSNFLHSGSFFTHLEANDTINYKTPLSTDICLFYNV